MSTHKTRKVDPQGLKDSLILDGHRESGDSRGNLLSLRKEMKL